MARLLMLSAVIVSFAASAALAQSASPFGPQGRGIATATMQPGTAVGLSAGAVPAAKIAGEGRAKPQVAGAGTSDCPVPSAGGETCGAPAGDGPETTLR